MSAVATISGRLTAVPQLRFIPSGDAVASFTVAHSRRKFDKATNTWSDDGEPLFLNVTAWKQLGEGAAEKLEKGDFVTVTGELQQRSWEKDGQKHTRIELIAKEIGLTVRARNSVRKEETVQEPAW
jgi:single-strand DNA-binding protein